jgi:hypothetical protein
LCSEHIFIGSLPNSLHAFTFAPSCPFSTQLPHNIHITIRNHIHVQFLIYEIKNGLGGKEKNWIPWVALKPLHHGCFHMPNVKACFHTHLLHWHLLLCKWSLEQCQHIRVKPN